MMNEASFGTGVGKSEKTNLFPIVSFSAYTLRLSAFYPNASFGSRKPKGKMGEKDRFKKKGKMKGNGKKGSYTAVRKLCA